MIKFARVFFIKTKRQMQSKNQQKIVFVFGIFVFSYRKNDPEGVRMKLCKNTKKGAELAGNYLKRGGKEETTNYNWRTKIYNL